MFARALVLFLCFLAGAALVARSERPERVPPHAPLSAFPRQLGEWRGVDAPPLEPNILAELGVDDYLTREYFDPTRAGVGLYVGYYGSQRQGDTMHSPQNCLPGAGWEPVSRRMLPISIAPSPAREAQEIVVNRYLIRKGIDQQLVLYWYQSHGRVVASEYWAKLYLIQDAVRLNRTDGALVRVITPVTSNTDGDARRAEETAVGFVQKLFPLLQHSLPE
jgi:EpsI family protein